MAELPSDAYNPQTVLIVDDEMAMRLFIATLFETSGYRPVTASDGKQGLAQAKALTPNLIILDVMMPGEGGALMYKALKSDPDLVHIPVIMLSAVGQESFGHYLNMLNAHLDKPVPLPEAYMEKPPDPDALLALAQNLLSGEKPTDGR